MAYKEENEAEGSKELREGGGGIRVLFPIFPFREELVSYVKWRNPFLPLPLFYSHTLRLLSKWGEPYPSISLPLLPFPSILYSHNNNAKALITKD